MYKIPVVQEAIEELSVKADVAAAVYYTAHRAHETPDHAVSRIEAVKEEPLRRKRALGQIL